MTPRVPAKKTAGRTASGRTSRSARQTTPPVVDDQTDRDDVAMVADLPLTEDTTFDQLDQGLRARVEQARQAGASDEEIAQLIQENTPEKRLSHPAAGSDQPERPTGMVTADGQKLKTEEVTFRGRTMVVCVPDEVQLAIMQRFSDQYASMADGKQVDAKVAIRMSGRAISIVQSVLADEDDKAWIEDALLRKEFEIMDALEIVEEAMQRLKIANAPNREERRAAEKSRLVTS